MAATYRWCGGVSGLLIPPRVEAESDTKECTNVLCNVEHRLPLLDREPAHVDACRAPPLDRAQVQQDVRAEHARERDPEPEPDRVDRVRREHDHQHVEQHERDQPGADADGERVSALEGWVGRT